MPQVQLVNQRFPWWQCRAWIAQERRALVHRIAADPLLFLSFVWTMDEHDSEKPFKRFPGPETHPYLWYIAREWYENPLIVVAKSRQMLATWLFASLFLWDAAFHRGRRIFFQSKKEDDAAAILMRTKGILQRLPETIRPRHHFRKTCLSFYQHDSEIKAIPQGGDQIRSYTASGILADEAAFQPEFAEAFAAAQPTIQGGGRFTVLSSANPGFFEMLYKDKLDVA